MPNILFFLQLALMRLMGITGTGQCYGKLIDQKIHQFSENGSFLTGGRFLGVERVEQETGNHAYCAFK